MKTEDIKNLLSRDLVKELHLDALSPEKLEETLARIGALIFKSVMMTSLERMSEREKERLDKLYNNNPVNLPAALEYIQSKVPDFEKIVEEEVAKFKEESLKAMGKL